MSGVETETEIPSLADAEQAKWRGRKEERTQAPCNVDTGDRALIGVQHSPIELYLTAFSITASLAYESQMSGCWTLSAHTHTHTALQIPVHYCPGAH